MFRSSYNRVCGASGSASMQIFHGKCHASENTPVIGRIVAYGELDRFSNKEALIVVLDGCSILPDDGRAVGIIRLSSDKDRAEISAPPCPAISLPFLPNICNGKIALLDPDSDTLFVSPDLTTVNRYTHLLCRPFKKRLPLSLSDGKMIQIFVIPQKTSDISGENEGYLIDTARFISSGDSFEERMFEAYRDAAERAAGLPMTALVSARYDPLENARALMRGAVFGKFSILLKDILTENDLVRSLDGFCRAFCELELEGREFNGYLQRGLYIGTPFLLSISKELRGVDFFTYDLQTLVRLMTDTAEDIPAEPLSALCKNICEIAKARPELGHSVILGKNTISPEACRILTEGGISNYFTYADEKTKLWDTLRKLLG